MKTSIVHRSKEDEKSFPKQDRISVNAVIGKNTRNMDTQA
jgi:hypothetical protein